MRRIGKHRGSSLVYLGFSIVVFIISYALLFTLVPAILGAFWQIADTVEMSESWRETNTEVEETTQYLIPLMPAMGIMLLVLKVLMAASTRGRD